MRCRATGLKSRADFKTEQCFVSHMYGCDAVRLHLNELGVDLIRAVDCALCICILRARTRSHLLLGLSFGDLITSERILVLNVH